MTTYHNGNNRAGAYVVSGLTLQAAAGLHLDATFAGRVNGHVYAQPLFWNPGNGNGGDGMVIVVTESNHVVALDATRGAVVWDQVLGPAVPRAELPCGNITPLGITGTPVIDAAAGTLYVAAQVNRQGAPAALVYGISLHDGSVVAGWPVDITADLAAKGLSFAPDVQGERGALTLAGGKLFVPFGGRNGDCGGYHGWVVGLQLKTPSVSAAWVTRGTKGGLWSVGGAVAVDGDVYVATGNTVGATSFGDGEAVIRLTASLQASNTPPDFFTPGNWQSLDNSDRDLGGTTPVPVDVGGRKLIVALGKDGDAYLLDRTNLGGIGGALAVQAVASGQIKGAAATWAATQEVFVTFVATDASCAQNPNRQGLTTIGVTGGATPALKMAWCAALSGLGSPIVTTSNGAANRIVWVAGGGVIGDQRLHGFDAATGAVIFAGGSAMDQLANVHQFSTILAANGRLYVPADGRIYAFTP